eukprot:TRINITY_DN23206_c0_g3_i1.p1 TRINITY_DN23206_c0_g3~~TRINITY_DN23206_c0_g3_i1.p1  ORF type:complete len:463 (+),score=32.90 TRINITY_DN23206_c0_g3_i1:71-1459(+)
MSIPPGTGDGNPVAFHKGLVELQERCDVFHDVLLASGLMGPQELQMRLHRRRFNAIRRRHPCVWQQSLSDTIANTSVAIHVENFMHLSTIHTVRSASTAFRSNFANRTHPVELGKLYWCSSSDLSDGSSERFWQGYDVVSNVWESLPCPSAVQLPRYAVGGCGSVYLCGLECLWYRFDTVTCDWYELPPMPSDRDDPDGALLEVMCGKLYVGGGNEDNNRPVLVMERFDPEQNVWEQLPLLSDMRVEFAWTVVNGSLYVCGGVHYGEQEPRDPTDWTGGLRPLTKLDAYDSRRDMWEVLPPMRSCSGTCSTASLEGNLYVVGGTGLATSIRDDGESRVCVVDLDTAERYSPKDQAWTPLPPMQKGRRNPSLATSRGCLYAWQDPFLERFDPASGWWELLSPESHACSPRGSLIPGSLFVFGSANNDPWSGIIGAITRFDPATCRWIEVTHSNGLGAFAGPYR